MRYRDQDGQDWADIIDFLTIPDDLSALSALAVVGSEGLGIG